MWKMRNLSKSQSGRENRHYVLIAAFGVAMLLIGGAWVLKSGIYAAAMPQSAEARAVVQRELRPACGDAGGRLNAEAFREIDLTGDGKEDFILSHTGVRCTSGWANMKCGLEGCPLLVFVRDGDELKLASEVDAQGYEVEKLGPVPVITYVKKGDQFRQLLWNGVEFRDMSKWEMPQGFSPQYLQKSIP